MDHAANVVKAVIHQPNPDYKDAYFQIGHFLCSMLYAYRFKIDANVNNYKLNKNELYLNYLFIIKDNILLDEHSKKALEFLHECKYELTSQKDLLIKCENILKICLLIINTLSIYEKIFDLQFLCYIILKRIFFTYPHFRKQIEDQLSVILSNLCLFSSKYDKENAEECKIFLHYLLQSQETSEDLKHKLKKRIEAKNCDIEFISSRSSLEGIICLFS